MLKKILINACANLLYWLSVNINKSLKIKVIGIELLEKLNAGGKPVIFASWHQNTFPLFYQCRNQKMCIMPIDSLEGEILAHFGRKYGFKTIQYKVNAHNLENTKCLINILKAIKSGYNLALAVDGPPGKLEMYKSKPGILFLSEKSRSPIIPVGVFFSKKILTPLRWDKYVIPLPFSEITIVLDEPFIVPEGLHVHEIESMTSQLDEKINAAHKKAKSA